MDETCDKLRRVFQTGNALTFAVSGTGMAGMECVAVNLIEPGDEVIVCAKSVFGGRMKDTMERFGAIVRALEAPWGETLAPDQIAAAFEAHPKCGASGLTYRHHGLRVTASSKPAPEPITNGQTQVRNNWTPDDAASQSSPGTCGSPWYHSDQA